MNLRLLRLAACLLIAMVQIRAAEVAAAVDRIDLGDARSEQAHGFVATGQATSEELACDIGLISERHRVRTVSKRTSGLRFTLQLARAPDSRAPILLEVEEIHDRRPQVFGYLVQVNGVDAYFRTYEEMAAGPNHYFLQVPAAATGGGTLAISIRNVGDAPFSLGRVWAYADFAALAAAEGTYQAMVVPEEPTVLLPILAPAGKEITGELRRKAITPEDEAKAWGDLRQLLQGTGYTPGIHTFLDYGNMSVPEMATDIDRDLARAAAQGVDLQITLRGTEWGAHPNGPDGLGGWFSDVTYSKIHYAPEVHDFRPCWPGTPGGTTWPTWDNPQLQRFLAYRIGRATRHLRDRLDLQAARGLRRPALVVNQEWGMSVGDCNDATIAAAAKDGVELPATTEPASDAAKRWIFANQCRVSDRFAAAFAGAIGRDAVVVDRGQLRLPAQQTRDDNYFQTFADPIAPFHDDRWAGWQMGVGPHAWSTGEYLPHLPAAYFDYIRARGKLACPNLERMALPTIEYLQTLYQRGFRLALFINTRSGDGVTFAREAAGLDARPADPPLHCDRRLLAVRFVHLGAFGPPEAKPEPQNLLIKEDENKGPADRLQVQDAARPGTITYLVDNPDPDPATPVRLELVGNIDAKAGNAITVAVGTAADALATVTTLAGKDLPRMRHYPWKNQLAVDLGKEIRNQGRFLVRITLQAASATGVSIDQLRIVADWGRPSGQPAGETFTVRQMRTFNLWIQDRAVYQRMAATYREEHGDDATSREAGALADQGRYLSAYRLLAGAASLRLPARFAVRGHGRLAGYPVEVELPDADAVALVDLASCGAGGCELALTAERPIRCAVRLSGLADGDGYAVEALGGNRYRIAPAAGSPTRVAGGSVRFDLAAGLEELRPRSLPHRLAGVFVGRVAGGMLISTQEEGLWLDNPILVATDPATTYSRTAAIAGQPVTADKPMDRDRVDLLIDDAGKATQVAATYGADQGRIKAFLPPKAKGQVSNGGIQLENGHRYEFSNMWGWTDLQAPPLKPFIRFNTWEQLAATFKPGQEVELTFCPYAIDGRLPRMIKLTLGHGDPPKP